MSRALGWAVILLTTFSCKTTEVSSELDGTLEEIDFARVNKPYQLDRVQIGHPNVGAPGTEWNVYGEYADNKWIVHERVYRPYWELYRKFMTGDPDDPSTLRCLRHRVHIYFGESPAPAYEAPKLPTIDNEKIALLDAEDMSDAQRQDAQQKACANASQAQYVMSFRLHNYLQPDAVRNFLVLAKIGFFDGNSLAKLRNSQQLPFFGLPPVDENFSEVGQPFHYLPDPRYTPATPELRERPSGGYDLSVEPAFTEEQRNAKIPSFLAKNLLVVEVANRAGRDNSREVLPFRAIISNIERRVEEQILQIVEKKTFPIIIGDVISPFDKSITNVSSLMTRINNGKKITVLCVAIDKPEVTNFIVADRRCPNVVGE